MNLWLIVPEDCWPEIWSEITYFVGTTNANFMWGFQPGVLFLRCFFREHLTVGGERFALVWLDVDMSQSNWVRGTRDWSVLDIATSRDRLPF